jgi:hypothetical protein
MEPGTRPQRIGVIVPPRPRLNEAALQSFVLAMNKEQSLIQFEFYKTGTLHPLMAVFSTKRKPVDRDWLFDDGCGSLGVSCSGGESVDALAFPVQVPGPVLSEVAVGVEGS